MLDTNLKNNHEYMCQDFFDSYEIEEFGSKNNLDTIQS